MLILSVILLVIVADRIEAACSMPVRKLAGAAIAAASKMRLIVNPLLEVSETTEPVPPDPEPLTAAMAWTDSSGRTGAIGVETGGSVLLVGVAPTRFPPPSPVEGPKAVGTKFMSPSPRSPPGSCGLETRRDLIA